MTNDSHHRVYFFLTLTAILWGGNAVAAKIVVAQLSPFVTIFARFTAVSLILLTLVWWQEKVHALPPRHLWGKLAVMGLIAIPLNNGLQFSGFRYSTAVNCTILSGLTPIFTACLAYFLLRERLNTRQWIGVAASLCGIVVLVSGGSWRVLSSLSFNSGDLLFLASYACWALYPVLGRQVMQELSPLATTAWTNALGTLLIAPLALRDGVGALFSISGDGWLSMLYMIIGSGVLAFCWWNQGVAKVGANKAAIFSNVNPLSGMIFGHLILSEPVGWAHLTGAAWIIGGVYLTTYEMPRGDFHHALATIAHHKARH